MPTLVFGFGAGADYAMDTTKAESANDTNLYGGDLRVFEFSNSIRAVSFFLFPAISNIPSGSIVDTDGVYLTLFGGGTGTPINTLELHGLRRAIVINQVSWSLAQTGISWTSGGAFDTVDDRYATVLASLAISTNGVTHQWDGSNLDDYIQDAIDDVVEPAMVLQRDVAAEDSTFRIFASEGTAGSGEFPVLSITYSEGSIVHALKRTNGSSGVLAHLRTSNGASGAEVVLKRTNGSTGIVINTSGA